MTNRLSEHSHDQGLVYARAVTDHVCLGFEVAGIFKSISRTITISNEGIEIAVLLDYGYACHLLVAHKPNIEYVNYQADVFVRDNIMRFLEERLKKWGELDEQYDQAK